MARRAGGGGSYPDAPDPAVGVACLAVSRLALGESRSGVTRHLRHEARASARARGSASTTTFHSPNPGTRDAGRETRAHTHTRDADGQTRTDSRSHHDHVSSGSATASTNYRTTSPAAATGSIRMAPLRLTLLLARAWISAACASVDTEESQAWLHKDIPHFSIRFQVHDWIQGMKVALKWPGGEPVEVEKVFQAAKGSGGARAEMAPHS